MKHIFCISLLLLSASCVFAQKIYVDRIETDGRRQVMATTKEYFVDDKDFKFCLKVFEGSDRRGLVAACFFVCSNVNGICVAAKTLE